MTWNRGPGDASALRGSPIAETAPTNGQTLAYNATTGLYVPQTPAAGGGVVTPIDAFTQQQWLFNDAAAPIANTVTPAATLASHGAAKFYKTLGPTGYAAFNNQAATRGGWSGASGAANRPSTNGFSVHGWVTCPTPTSDSTYGCLIVRHYYANSAWNAPFASLSLEFTYAGGFAGYLFRAYVAKAGAIFGPYGTAVLPMQRSQIGHFAMTFDDATAGVGGTILLYFNGLLIASQAFTGPIDWGTDGPWTLGDIQTNAAPQSLYGGFMDWRVETTVRTQAYFQALVNSALGLNY